MRKCKFCGRELKGNERCTCPGAQAMRRKVRMIALIAGALVLTIIIVAIVVGTSFRTSTNNPSPETTGQENYAPATEPFESEITSTPSNTDAGGTESITSAQREKIDPANYLNEPVFEGFDGEGRVTVTLDRGDLVGALIGDDYGKYDFYNDLVNEIKVTISTETSLKNGDEIRVSITVPDALCGEVKNAEAQYTVLGLTELHEIDLLSLFEVKPDGISGEAKLKMSINDYLTIYDFDVTPGTTNLCNGDVVTMTLKETAIKRLATEHHIKPTNTILTQTVQGLEEYVTTADQLPKDIIDEITALFILKETPEDNFLLSYGDIAVYSIYFMNGQSNEAIQHHNILKIIVFYDVYSRDEYTHTNYVILNVYDITKKSDGAMDIVYDLDVSDYTTDIDMYLSTFMSEYTVTQIK